MQEIGFIFVGKEKSVFNKLDSFLPEAPRKWVDDLSNESSIFSFWPIYFIDLTTIKNRNFLSLKEGQVVFIVSQKSDLDNIYEFPSNFLGVLTHPITKTQLVSLIKKATDLFELYTDILHMTKEISLEREILARKNALLTFLNRILTRANECLDVERIFQIAREELENVLSTEGVGGIFWWGSDADAVQCFIPQGNQENVMAWQEFLLSLAERFHHKIKEFQLNLFKIKDIKNFSRDKVILVPLKSQKSVYGCLVVLSPERGRLGKDQVQVLHSACNHLGLAILNALRFEEIKVRADHDGLTGLYNRRHFEESLHLEIKRHQRNGRSLGLLLLDVDFFKSINDKYGHLVGDMVLKKIANLVQTSVRETDIVARYGGEEFVVLLPETTEECAWILAQRIREKIEKTYFAADGKKFRVTVSIGVTSLRPGPFTPAENFILEADQALYLAKNSGRNMVCTSSEVKCKELPN